MRMQAGIVGWRSIMSAEVHDKVYNDIVEESLLFLLVVANIDLKCNTSNREVQRHR